MKIRYFVQLFSALLLPSVVQSVLDEYKRQIETSRSGVESIINHIKGNGKHETYRRLAELGDMFGSRLTGSQIYEDSLDYILANFTEEGFANVAEEELPVPKWVRGNEWAELHVLGRTQKLPILSLGSSIGTIVNFDNFSASENILTAEVLVVNSFDELEQMDISMVRGKIVVYNVVWLGSYPETVPYRSDGAIKAAEKGAVASLVHSVTEYSISSPHTGQMQQATIPGACISLEDSRMMKRMQDRGWQMNISLYMEAKNEPNTTSRNLVAEIVGSEFPEEVVIFGGHIDTWDVGHGSMDDGGGVMIAWQALSVMKSLNIIPRRTIRLVLWTAEEEGLIGGEHYYEVHKSESDQLSLIIESDAGAFKPRGIGFTGSGLATSIMQEILSTYLGSYNMTTILPDRGASSDTREWVINAGVPSVELYSYNEDYFHYHHTHGDTMEVLNADDLDSCTILWATVALTVANLDSILPRHGDAISAGVSVYSSWLALTSLLLITVTSWRCRR